MTKKVDKKDKINMSWWKWIFFVFGLFMIFSPLFWIIHIIAYYSNEKRNKFLDKSFCKITYVLGVLVVILLILGFSLGAFSDYQLTEEEIKVLENECESKCTNIYNAYYYELDTYLNECVCLDYNMNEIDIDYKDLN